MAKTRRAITLTKKLQIINASASGSSQNKLASDFKLQRVTIQKILKNADKVKKARDKGMSLTKTRTTPARMQVIEDKVVEWVEHVRTKHKSVVVTGNLIKVSF